MAGFYEIPRERSENKPPNSGTGWQQSLFVLGTLGGEVISVGAVAHISPGVSSVHTYKLSYMQNCSKIPLLVIMLAVSHFRIVSHRPARRTLRSGAWCGLRLSRYRYRGRRLSIRVLDVEHEQPIELAVPVGVRHGNP